MAIYYIEDIALFYRNLGSTDKQPRKKKTPISSLRKALFNPDTANAAAVGATLGVTADQLTKRLGGLSADKKTRILGVGGTAIGAGLGALSKLKKQRQAEQTVKQRLFSNN